MHPPTIPILLLGRFLLSAYIVKFFPYYSFYTGLTVRGPFILVELFLSQFSETLALACDGEDSDDIFRL